jgi:hypothetical protein
MKIFSTNEKETPFALSIGAPRIINTGIASI